MRRRLVEIALAGLAIALPALLLSLPSWAAGRVALATGTGVQSVTLSEGAKVSVQCPNLDGGSGQKVYYRTGGTCSGCTVADAGVGDVLMDFTTNPDPYPIQLGPKETLLHLRSYDPSVLLYCPIFPRVP